MKKVHFILLLICLPFVLSAQVTGKGKPKSWSSLLPKNTLETINMPSFDLNAIQQEDAINDLDREKPFRFGYEFAVNLGMNNSGQWDELEDGGRIWRINLASKGAKTLNFILDTYKMPKGATLYLYNQNRTDLLGAYTDVMNRDDQMLGTWLVEGDNIILEYYEPKNVIGQGELHISKVIHGYRSVTNSELLEKGLNDSGNCNHDVDCPVRDDFEDLKNLLKRSVAFILMDGFVCTGSLINNTENDGAPYFLTARHCNAGAVATWAFRFNWISPNPSCATTENSTDASEVQTTSGSTLLATNSETDVRLLRLDGGLDNDWDLEWAGWDRTGRIPNYVMGIHHPVGDIMKVCIENQPPTKTLLNFEDNPRAQMWRIANWDLGVTEGGSSGSALFDEQGRIVGQLAGGSAACIGINDNNRDDFYGRFDVSWDFGNSNSTRLSNWLDPNNTGRTTLDMLSVELEALGVEDQVLKDKTTIHPNPTKGLINIDNVNHASLDYEFYTISGRFISSGTIGGNNHQLDFSNLPVGVYFLKVNDVFKASHFIQKIIIE